MAIPKLYDLVRVTTATTGTGTITLGAAVANYLTFALGGVPDGATVRYGIVDANGARSTCHGVYSLSGLTLTRVHESSSTGSLLNLSGSAQVFITPSAADFSQTQGIAARDANGVWNGRTITATTNGGVAVTNGDGASGDPTLALGNYLPTGTGAVARAVAGRLTETVSVKDFGAVGDGTTDDTAAVQAAIDAACPFVWKGSTRATEMDGRSGRVFFPKGIYRVTSVLRLAPNLVLAGEATANDWTVRSGSAGTPTGGVTRLGSAIFSDISSGTTYAIDTSPYNSGGSRVDGRLQQGGDSYNGLYTECHGIEINDMTFYGNWTCKGLNMAGAVKCLMHNVVIAGFHVGVRWSSSWYSQMSNVRIFAGWKGIMTWMAATDLSLINVSIKRPAEAPSYSDSDGALPPTTAWWVAGWNADTCGITNYYGNIAANNLTVEGFNIYSAGYNAVNDFCDVYIEGITGIAIISLGSDQQNERHVFDTIVSNSGDLIACYNSRLEVGCLSNNYTQAGFGKLFYDVVNTVGLEVRPVIWGLKFNGTDVFTKVNVSRADAYYSEGTWTPTLLAGGATLGTQSSNTGRFVRIGNLVTIWAYIVLPTKNSATGSLTVGGLPFISNNQYGTESSSVLAFGYAAPAAGSAISVTSGSYAVSIIGKTNADILNGADIRFSIQYETTENSRW